MSADELTRLGLVEAAGKIRRGELSALELTQAYLDRIALLDGRLNSYLTVTAEPALEAARRADAGRASGSTVGSLGGLPLSLKDLFETAGVRTTAGSKFFATYIPETDAQVVTRLKVAGAALLGKTNMHEIALGLTTVNPHFGPCHNPWNSDHVPGGSSGGSAAALAARLCAGSLGTDTGGSIRVPAALCGIVGLKPTYGRVSLRGVIPLSWNLDHVGPMARRVEDAAWLLQVIAGYDPADPASVDQPVDDYQTGIAQGVAGWRIALAQGEYFDRSDPEVQAAVGQAARTLAGLGAQVEPYDFVDAYPAALANGLMVVSDAAAFHHERLANQPEDFGEDVRQRLQTGAALPLLDYIRARRTQIELHRSFTRLFEHYDLLLLPTTPVAAPPISGPNAVELARLLTRYTAPFNLTGLPAMSLPCGFTAAGLPIGLQMVSAPWNEARLLCAGYAYQKACDWYSRFPEDPGI